MIKGDKYRPEMQDKTARYIEILRTASNQGKNPISKEEASDLLAIGVRGVREAMNRHPEIKRYIESDQEKNKRLLRDAISHAVSVLRNDGVVFNIKMIAERMKEYNLAYNYKMVRTAMWKYGWIPEDFTPDEEKIVYTDELMSALSLSIGDLFKEAGLSFDYQMIAHILQVGESELRMYLHKHKVLKKELRSRGLLDKIGVQLDTKSSS
jgi:hypothetical protein